MGEVAFNLLFPIWREHPHLEPADLKEPSGYDPRDFMIPPAAAEEALRALARAHVLVEMIRTRIEQEPNEQERNTYLAGLKSVTREIEDATAGVQRRRAR
jgi:hypothetical protein